MPDKNLTKLPRKNLLHATQAIIGSELFRHLYVRDKAANKDIDAVKDGSYSCALVVSSLLSLQGLLDRPHATVTTTLNKMQEAGWFKIAEPRPAAIVEWPMHESHPHIGIMLNETTCVSNSDRQRVPVRHPLKMYDGREPIAYYWHNDLDTKG